MSSLKVTGRVVFGLPLVLLVFSVNYNVIPLLASALCMFICVYTATHSCVFFLIILTMLDEKEKEGCCFDFGVFFCSYFYKI